MGIRNWALVNIDEVYMFPTLKASEIFRKKKKERGNIFNTYKKVGPEKWLLRNKRISDEEYLSYFYAGSGAPLYRLSDIVQENDIVNKEDMM